VQGRRDPPSRVACQGDSGAVPAELDDVPLDPLQGELLVEEPVVAGKVLVTGAEEAEDSETVLDGDDDDATGHDPLRTLACVAEHETPPVKERHDGVQRTTISGWRVDVNQEAVLSSLQSGRMARKLHTGWTECCGIDDGALGDWCCLFRWL